ncbi:MAG: hypothetical protein HeimC2_42030 [Candidatus Heimdallarchaeota archaeon LC_2]|nr:MAG: hypothetical protein HeimC2_42030 [Candidatus Heimdallarchaeota archaeon LC_2]
MTASRFKGYPYVRNLSVLILLLLFVQPLVNYHPILSSSGKNNQIILFYEGFEELTSSDLLSEDFNSEVTGNVPFGITSESAHSDSHSLFVGPSTCGSFCFDDFSVKITFVSMNLADDEYTISYWRRESRDFGGAFQVLIDGQLVYIEEIIDGVWNTGEDTGWYGRFFIYNGSINSLTFRETDLTNSNTIYIDDITIQKSDRPQLKLDLGFSGNELVLGFVFAMVISVAVIVIKTRSSQSFNQ